MTHQQLLDEYVSLPNEAQRQVDDFVAFLQHKYKAVKSVTQSHSRDLENEPFLGMWRNRRDFEDSSAWVRNNRKAEWGETL